MSRLGLATALWLLTGSILWARCTSTEATEATDSAGEESTVLAGDAADVPESTDAEGDDAGGADANSAADADSADGASCPDDAVMPFDNPTPHCDQPGLVCTWPALGCPAGALPPITCACNGSRFGCEGHLHNCLPLETSGVPEGTPTRPLPPHRPVAEPCPATPPKSEAPCFNGSPLTDNDTCATDFDCAEPDERCRAVHVFGADFACRCVTDACTVDDDCGPTGVCVCRSTNPSGFCGGWTKASCTDRCVPASCRTDPGCGPDRFCSPNRDICGQQIVGYACHDPSVDECFSDWECQYNAHCLHDEDGWSCVGSPVCD